MWPCRINFFDLKSVPSLLFTSRTSFPSIFGLLELFDF